MYTGIEAHIKKFVGLTEEEIAVLHAYMKRMVVKKKELLLKEGQVCKSNYFVEKGCLRLFFVDEKGAEQTTQFAIENWWLTDYSSFYRATPSQFYIQAVENATVISFDKSLQEELYKKLPQLERYFRNVLEVSYGAVQWRIKYIYNLSKEDMYRNFNSLFPGFVQRVPQYMLASYLGLTPQYLSELRKKKQ